MLLVGHENFVSCLHVDSVGDLAVGLGGIANQSNLVAFTADELGQRVAKLAPRGVSPDGVVLRILLVHLFGLGVAIENSAQNGRGTRPHGAIVQVNLIGRNQKLLAKLGPISIWVAAVETRNRELSKARSETARADDWAEQEQRQSQK